MRNASCSVVPGKRGTPTELSDVNSYVSRVWPTSAGLGSDRLHELVEQRAGVVRTRGCLGVVLHREDRFFSVSQPLDRAIVEIDVRDLELRSARDRVVLAGHREAMVLRRDEDVAARHLADGMIPAAMTVRHL